jgi:hypothetical protein
VFVATGTRRLVDDRNGLCCRAPIVEALVRAVLLHYIKIYGRHTPVGREADFDAALEAGPRRAHEVFLVARHAHHHGPAELLRHQRRNRHQRIGAAFRAEAAAAELGDIHEIGGLDAAIARDPGDRKALALRRAVKVTLAVLPVRECAARLHRVVPEARRHESLVEHELRSGETRIDVAERPFRERLALRQLSVLGAREILSRPFDVLELDALHDITVRARVRPAGEQALQRVDRERQLFVGDLDLLEGVARELLGVGRDGENRMADEQRLVRENRLLRRRRVRDLIGPQNAVHTGHRERGARVDARHSRMRHGARQQLHEHHALGTEVLGVLRFARHLRVHIGRREILAKQVVGHVSSKRVECAAPEAARQSYSSNYRTGAVAGAQPARKPLCRLIFRSRQLYW